MNKDMCVCRNCPKVYDQNNSRADYMGYCSMKCQHEKAKKLGYKKSNERLSNTSEWHYLHDRQVIGRVPYVDALAPRYHKIQAILDAMKRLPADKIMAYALDQKGRSITGLSDEDVNTMYVNEVEGKEDIGVSV